MDADPAGAKLTSQLDRSGPNSETCGSLETLVIPGVKSYSPWRCHPESALTAHTYRRILPTRRLLGRQMFFAAGRTNGHQQMKLSIVIPAHNEADALRDTVTALETTLSGAGVPHEILVVNDHSSDGTAGVVAELEQEFSAVRGVENEKPGGFGYAVRTGLEEFRGDAVCIVMADASDDPNDVVRYYGVLRDGYDCAFGSRFTPQSRVVGYPWFKLALNRVANSFIRIVFHLAYNDVTNGFKCYRREVIHGIQPILSCHFNLTVELPLKAITRGYSYRIVSNNWYNRTTGISKLKVKEMGSRYLFIVLYVLLEKLLSHGDYRRRDLD